MGQEVPNTVNSTLASPKGLMAVESFKRMEEDPKMMKNIDPVRFLDKSVETHTLAIVGDVQAGEVADTFVVPMQDLSTNREQKLPTYLLQDFRFGTGEVSWYRHCRNEQLMINVFTLDKWVPDLSSGFMKFGMSFYDKTLIRKQFNMTKRNVQIAMSRTVASLKADGKAEIVALAADRNAIISWLYSTPYKDTLRKVYLDEKSQPIPSLAARASGYFTCTVFESPNNVPLV